MYIHTLFHPPPPPFFCTPTLYLSVSHTHSFRAATDGTLIVTGLVPQGAAQGAGVMIGDVVVSVEGVKASSLRCHTYVTTPMSPHLCHHTYAT